METGPGPTGSPDQDQRTTEQDRAQRSPAAPRSPVAPRGADSDSRAGYLGFVAHEVRNPLSTALWSAELLARMPGPERSGPRGEKLSAMCLRSLSRVRQLVEDHFMCERLDVAGLPFRPELIDLREVLDVLAAKRPSGTPLDVQVEAGVTVESDRSLVERALDALVAVAGRDGAPVIATAEVAGDRLRLTLRGNRAAAEVLDDPRKGSPGEPRGRALAGPLARRAAEALGGALTIEDDAFVLTLAGAAYTSRAS